MRGILIFLGQQVGIFLFSGGVVIGWMGGDVFVAVVAMVTGLLFYISSIAYKVGHDLIRDHEEKYHSK
ncbi:MAG: hypothetical protein C4584_01145 [Armatimonadetes bacterium]|nr:MAG: hypothetical protein C4584_01145 [Armatimonadota bacterium]